jgi:NAD(P)H-dependent flavin oxidoreductase YrpB (nitropropane dioxygenase family)
MFEFSQLRLPIIQAPMAAGLNTPLLANSVCNEGGVGSFDSAYTDTDKIA